MSSGNKRGGGPISRAVVRERNVSRGPAVVAAVARNSRGVYTQVHSDVLRQQVPLCRLLVRTYAYASLHHQRVYTFLYTYVNMHMHNEDQLGCLRWRVYVL